jgi:hypothetical protein
MLRVRKSFLQIEDVRSERGRDADPPLRKVAVVYVLENPFASDAYQEDLSSLTHESKAIGDRMGADAVAAMRPFAVESYGKGALIGLGGEQEHGVALLTTVYGNAVRDAIGGGKAWISSFTKRAAPGASIDVPLAHKDALYVRSHYDGITITLPDGPLHDEIALICVVANRGRLNHRVGGLKADEIRGEDGLV